jgi:hypothetical protein
MDNPQFKLSKTIYKYGIRLEKQVKIAEMLFGFIA